MNALRLATLLVAGAAFGTQAQTTAPAAPAASAAPMAQGCPKDMRHDHGKERGQGATSAAMPCGATTSADAASAPKKSKAKTKSHDHAKFHKTM